MPSAHVVVRSVAEAQGRDGTARGRVLGAQVRWSKLGGSRLEPAGDATPPGSFDVLPSDHDIAGTLRRWARASGYEFVWDVDWIAPVNGPAHLAATNFLDAVRQVAAGLRAQGYPLRAQAFSDRVVRFSAPE
jgi:hypothetical protein